MVDFRDCRCPTVSLAVVSLTCVHGAGDGDGGCKLYSPRVVRGCWHQGTTAGSTRRPGGGDEGLGFAIGLPGIVRLAASRDPDSCHFMLQMSGLELYEKIRERRCVFATILILTEPRIDVAVNAVRMGTVDVLCLPLERECFQQALKQARNRLDEMQRELLLLPPILPEGRSYLSLLTRRETQVVELVCDGATNREISAELGICKKTVERHRSNAMKKMRVNSVARLTRLVDRERQQRHFRRPRVMERFRSVAGYR